jgi:hypothetical protein
LQPNLQHAIERVERPGGSHEGVGTKKNPCKHFETEKPKIKNKPTIFKNDANQVCS